MTWPKQVSSRLFATAAAGSASAAPPARSAWVRLSANTESGFELEEGDNASAQSAQSFSDAIEEGARAFVGVLDGYSVADLSGRSDRRT